MRKIRQFADRTVAFLNNNSNPDEVAEFIKMNRFFDESRLQDYFSLAPEMTELFSNQSAAANRASL